MTSDPTHARVRQAYARYDDAQGSRDRETVVRTRLELCEALVATGWDAPPEVLEQMARDRKTLARMAEDQGGYADGLLRPPAHRPPLPR